ncbi:MAG: dipicolinate synthase subunit B [Bacillota bacterium]|jgi:dipicolinate synthase subunit B
MTEQISLTGLRIGFALTGSHCTLKSAVVALKDLRDAGADILPIISENVKTSDTKFGLAGDWREQIIAASGSGVIIDSIVKAEPIGPQKLLDLLVIAPCSGNTLGKLANAVTDTPVLMAAKSQLRNSRPIVVAISTNDGLAANAKNIGQLINSKHIYFVPFGQDNPEAKAASVIADMTQIVSTVEKALQQQQIQPLLISFNR